VTKHFLDRKPTQPWMTADSSPDDHQGCQSSIGSTKQLNSSLPASAVGETSETIVSTAC